MIVAGSFSEQFRSVVERKLASNLCTTEGAGKPLNIHSKLAPACTKCSPFTVMFLTEARLNMWPGRASVSTGRGITGIYI